MGSSLKTCLKYKEQLDQELNQELAWRKLEYLASNGKLLLFVDNVNKTMSEDSGLQRLNSIPGVIVLISRQTSFSIEFEPYCIREFQIEQCRELFEKICFAGSGKKIKPEETQDLEYVMDKLAGRNPLIIEILAHLAGKTPWTVKRLREKLENNGFRNQSNVSLFLSYNWHDGKIADTIDKNLSGCSGITVKRDIRDIGPWKSIREFMKSIRKQDYAILIISDYYLKSKNCMFEVTEIMKEQEYGDRILLAVVDNKIYDPIVRVKYIKYWQDECNKLEAAISELDPINSIEPVTDLKCYKSIASSMGEFLSMAADRNNPNIQDIEKEIMKAIFKNL